MGKWSETEGELTKDGRAAVAVGVSAIMVTLLISLSPALAQCERRAKFERECKEQFNSQDIIDMCVSGKELFE